MHIGFYNEEPESYGSYKKRFFNKFTERIRLMNNGIENLSLKDKDKALLKKQLREILK